MYFDEDIFTHGWRNISIGGWYGYQADNWHSSGLVSGVSDWIFWSLRGRHSLSNYFQSLVRDGRRCTGRISGHPSLDGQTL